MKHPQLLTAAILNTATLGRISITLWMGIRKSSRYGAEANKAGFPILRSGRVASFPLTPTAKVKTFLLDFPVFKGNSGGPVFIDHRIRAKGRKTLFGNFASVLGIVSQEISANEKVKRGDKFQIETHRLGIAVVVHASFIADLVNSLQPPAQ